MNKMIILVGNIASGKSTFAENSGEITINQDLLGTRENCFIALEPILQANRNVIIDRTNISKKQREPFIKLAKEYCYDVDVINFVANPEKCLERVKNRKDHPTIKENTSDEKIKSIIARFEKNYEVPTKDEGIDSIITIIVDPPSPS